MARFANRFADSHESPDCRELFQGSRTEPLLCKSGFRGLKSANPRFEAIRANRSQAMKTRVLLNVDSLESIRANRPDSRCESPDHLSSRELFDQSPPRDNLAACHNSLEEHNWEKNLQGLKIREERK